MSGALVRRIVAGTVVGALGAAAVLGGCVGGSATPEGTGTSQEAIYVGDATADGETGDGGSEVQEGGEASESPESSEGESETSEAEAGAPACAGDPSVVVGSDGGATCTGNLAQATFQRAICTCGSLVTSGGLTTDGFNSTLGPPDGGLGGNIAVDQSVTWTAHTSVGGDLVIPDNLSASATGTVRGNLYLGGHGTASATVTVDGNAYLVGALPHDVTVDGTVSTVSSVAAECNCAQPLPVAAIVAAHRPPNNDNATIGLSSTAATGSHAARIDLPCGNFYLTQIDVSGALTIWAHGHTALFIDGSIVASAPLTFGIDEGATLDLFVAGNVETSALLTLGETTSPAACRAYLSGTQLAMSGGATLGCNLYAPLAAYDSSATDTVYGSLFVGSIAASGATTVHFDMAIENAGAECCAAGSCDDNNPCTVDACAGNGTCTHTPAANGTTCSGTNLCDKSYTCQAGACTGSNPVVCTASDQCHAVGVCSPTTGACSNPTAPNGTSCNDGSECTSNDQCTNGTCGGTSITCTAEDQCHTAGTCNPATGTCSNPVAPNGTACNDGNACSTNDVCTGGACAGTPVTCTAEDQCHGVGTCSPATGACSNPPLVNGTVCSTGNRCFAGDTCQAGTCTNGTPVTCMAGGPCTMPGVCNPSTGVCTNPALPDGTACTNGSLCFTGDMCEAGACANGTPITCTASGPCTTAGTCDPSTGVCSNPAAANGTACSTGNLCFTGDSCEAGSCTNGAPVTCTASDQCHVAGTCSPSTGTCSNPEAPAGTTCNDQNPCTMGDECTSGTCAGTPVTCTALDSCHTAGTCDPTSGVCSNPVIPGCDPNPIAQSPFEPNASLMGKVVDTNGNAVTGFTILVYDAPASGSPRSDVVVNTASDGSFRARLTQFPTSEPFGSPPHHEILKLQSTGAIPVMRDAYLHVGTAQDLGIIMVQLRDSNVTVIGPAGGTAIDSQNLVEVDFPPGAVTVPTSFVITPIAKRAAVPFPLPDVTATTYAVELEPTGAQFAQPVTVRVANTLNLPTSLVLPVGFVDDVNAVWRQEGEGRWDGQRFAFTAMHFTSVDMNPNGPPIPIPTPPSGPDPGDCKGANCPCVASRALLSNGAIRETIATPTYQRQGRAYGVTLAYDSVLAMGQTTTTVPSTSYAAVPHSTLVLRDRGIRLRDACPATAPADQAYLSSASCAAGIPAPGSAACAPGAQFPNGLVATISVLGSTTTQALSLPANATDLEFGQLINVPLTDANSIPSSGFQRETVSLSVPGGSACVTSGGTFGATGTTGGVQTTQDTGPVMTIDRDVLLHQRHASPFGAGWAVQEVGRVYRDPFADRAVVANGDGTDETFQPRTTTTKLLFQSGSSTLATDRTTGQSFFITSAGVVNLINADGTFTPVLTGLSFDGGLFAADTTYVGGVRHFIIALTTRLLDVDSSGNARTLTTRPPPGDVESVFTSPGVAAYNGIAAYVDWASPSPGLVTFDLSQALPTPQPLSQPAGGDIGLDPQATLSGVTFGEPHGLAFSPTGDLYVADRARNAVYDVHPLSSGQIGQASMVTRMLGDGAGRALAPLGYRYAGPRFSIAEPIQVSVSADGTLWITNLFGVAVYDPTAQEARWLVVDKTVPGSELLQTFVAGTVPSTLANGPTSAYFYDGTELVRFDVGLSSEFDPTRTLSFNATSGVAALVDTTADRVETYDAAGRLTQQSQRTGEPLRGVTYVDSSSDLVASLTDPVGGATTFTYDGTGHLAAIMDGAGRVTGVTVNSAGDLVSVTEPDGEVETFQYQDHRVSQKQGPNGDVTTYTYASDGSLQTATKPAGEVTSLAVAFSQPPQRDPSGNTLNAGSYTDTHGVAHGYTLDFQGHIASDTYVASGVSYANTSVQAGVLTGSTGDNYTNRANTLGRIAFSSVNGLDVGLESGWDSLGRLSVVYQGHPGSTQYEQYLYDSNGFLSAYYQGPTADDSFAITRDPAGHLLKLAEISLGAPYGHEIDYTWNAQGLPVTYTEHGVTTTYTYDANGNVQSTVDTVGRTTAFTRDAASNALTSNDGATTTSYTYDANNRLLASADALSNTTTYTYAPSPCNCSNNELVATVHTPDLAAGLAWTMQYTSEGRLAAALDPNGHAESYTYQPSGELTQLVDRDGNATNTAYDQLGRVSTIMDAIQRSHARAYPVQTATGWVGPTLLSGGASSTTPTVNLTGTLNAGDYQIGTNGDDVYAVAGNEDRSRGEPQVSLYRDATLQLTYGLVWDGKPNITQRTDRDSLPFSSPQASDPSQGQFFLEQTAYEPFLGLSTLPGIQGSTSGGFNENSDFSYNTEHDLVSLTGWANAFPYLIYTYTRDAAGRLTGISQRYQAASTFFEASSFSYYPDGKLMQRIDADGEHDFSYDTRGLLSSIAIPGEGTYSFTYDSLERNETLTYPDGHQRVQMYDNEGRLVSRCYEYTGGLESRCYTASYDPVGNPVTMTDPEGTDTLVYDGLNRLVQVSRSNGVVEDYAFNTMGALSVNAGALLDVQRPRLDGNGFADSALPNTYNGLAVTLDSGGRVTSLNGAALAYGKRNELQSVTDGVTTETYGYDGFMRRIARVNNQGIDEYYLYEGATLAFGSNSLAPAAATLIAGNSRPGFDRTPNTLGPIDRLAPQNVVAVLDSSGGVTSGLLYDGVDLPLRLARSGLRYYYEVDVAGNVRRIRDINGLDLGGYRYTAFGIGYPADATTPVAAIQQPLQWKGRWASSLAGGIYDVRARQWSPGIGAFTVIDEFEHQDGRSTLWAWGGQNPVRFSDPSGRDAVNICGGLISKCGYPGACPSPPPPPPPPTPYQRCIQNCYDVAGQVYDTCMAKRADPTVCAQEAGAEGDACRQRNGCP